MNRFARLGTELLAPWVWVLLLPLAVAWDATDGEIGPALLWGLIVGITGSLIPMAVIVRGARQGKWDGHHVTDRAGRLVPLAVVGASLGTGFAVLLLGGAPPQMVALAASMLASLVAGIVITFGLEFKISLHAGAATSAIIVLALTFGPAMLLGALLAVWVCWSRVKLGDHTYPEVATGTLLGIVVGGLGYWLILIVILFA